MIQILTSYWAKPIPMRQFDWQAWCDGDEPNDDGQMLVGYGCTKADAIDDLIEQITECPFPSVGSRDYD